MPTFYPGQKDYIQQLNRLDAVAEAAQGEQGIQGIQGVPGPGNVLSIGTVANGASAAATISGTSPAQILNLTLPQGIQGIQGIQGVPGPSNALAIGTVNTGTAAATITGTSPSQTLNLTLPTAAPNTLAIGTVTQGTAAATVTGAAPNQTLNLVLPPGPANSLAIGSVGAGTAAATITGTAPSQTLNLTLPPGPANSLAIGTVTSGTAAATITGTAPSQTLNLVLQTGATGARGVTPRGAWASGTAYAVDDLAYYLGSTYRRLVAGTTATAPSADATNWAIFAQKGVDGAGAVSTVNSIGPDMGGNVVLVKADLGLGSVDNTSDAGKPVSTAQQTALDLKANLASPTFTGNTGVGTAGSASISLAVNRQVAGSATSYGVRSSGVVQSTVTEAMSFAASPGTAAASFTLDYMHHFFAGQGTIGAGSTVNNQIGYYVAANLTGATNNFGFHGNIASAAGRWNLYMSGTASNYMAGKLLIGSASDSGELLQVNGTAKFTGAVSGLTKTTVGLANVDNTSDANKPVSTAQQTALDLKAPLASPTLTGTPAAPTATAGTNTTQLATTAFVAAAVTVAGFQSGDIMASVRALTAPSWLLCDGSYYLRTSYPALSTLIPFAYAPVKVANPATLPDGAAACCMFSPDTAHLWVGQAATPYVKVYKRAGDVFTKLTDGSLPNGAVKSLAVTADGVYTAAGCTAVPVLMVYKRSGGADTYSFIGIGAATPPPSAVLGVAFSSDGVYLAAAGTGTPFVSFYKRSGDTFTKLSNPATLPAGDATSASMTPDGVYCCVQHATSPFFSVYKRSGDTWTKLADPSSLPIAGNGCAFSPDGTYLALGHDATPYLTIYKKDGSDVFTKLTLPGSAPTSAVLGASYSLGGAYLTLALGGSPYMATYRCVGDTLTAQSAPATLPTGGALGAAWGAAGTYLAVSHNTSPYISIYNSGGDMTLLRVPTITETAPVASYIKT